MDAAVLIFGPPALALVLLAWMIILPRVAGRRSGTGAAGNHDLQVALEGHIRAVASQPHNLQHPDALEAAAYYIENQIRACGRTPVLQQFDVDGVAVRNIEIVFEPAKQAPISETIIIGAHYDAAEDRSGAR